MKRYREVGIILLLILSTLILSSCKKESAIDGFEPYKKAWVDGDYSRMYDMISQESRERIDKEEFIERYENIFTGIGARNIKIENIEEDGGNISFKLEMDTSAGQLVIEDYEAEMVQEKVDKKNKWFVNWDESLIFPQMEREDKVRVVSSKAKRGEIYDRFGDGLAINGKRYSVGIHPSKYDQANTPIFAQLLDIDEDFIEKELDKNTNPEHFVPIAKLSLDDKDLLESLLELEGVIYQEVEDRVYPGGQAFGSLIGYIKPITAEELEKDQEGLYTRSSLVGKFGLEEVFEDRLRAIDGREIYISKIKDGKEVDKVSLIKRQAQDGQDLHISVDKDLQKTIYREMDGELGASTAIDPKTGQVLAMVSSPSFDSNLYTTYISNSAREKLNNPDLNVFENKFNKAYSPGSTFKLVTSAIGLETGKIDPKNKIEIKGKGWQKDSSWGNYKINRVNPGIENLDLNDAIVYSDNIYFARAALDIGDKDFLKGAESFGFGEDIPVEYPMAASQLTNNNKFENEILLGDSGYGQGEILMSPLHLSLVYSSLVNQGNIMEAKLLMDKEEKIWKENLISKDKLDILLTSFTNVIEDPKGTGHKAKINKISLAGKTGTAELKESQEGRGKAHGWFVAMDVEDPTIVLTMMVEDVSDKGGSGYVVSKVGRVMKSYLTKD